jgi:hypothetical protein
MEVAHLRLARVEVVEEDAGDRPIEVVGAAAAAAAAHFPTTMLPPTCQKKANKNERLANEPNS